MILYAESISVMSDSFATPWTVAHQAPLSMGILQASILEWVAMPSFRGSSQPRSNPGLPYCRWILYCLSHQGKPTKSQIWGHKSPSLTGCWESWMRLWRDNLIGSVLETQKRLNRCYSEKSEMKIFPTSQRNPGRLPGGGNHWQKQRRGDFQSWDHSKNHFLSSFLGARQFACIIEQNTPRRWVQAVLFPSER